MKAILVAITVAVFLISGAFAQEKNLPRFEGYPAQEKFMGKPAPAIISHPRARLFRTMIRTQARNEPNFAGRYTLATWGCGSGCQGFAMIDAQTGRVYFNPKALNVGTVPYQDEDSLQFRTDSRLLVVSGYVDGFRGYQSEAKFYYEWKNDRFRLIRKTKIKKYAP
ncbi:MAG: hypothetical protein ACREBG_06260 [Pyrinomonadaceae bacterium]